MSAQHATPCRNEKCNGGQEVVTIVLHTPIELFVRRTLRPWLKPNFMQQKVPCHICRPTAREQWERAANLNRRQR